MNKTLFNAILSGDHFSAIEELSLGTPVDIVFPNGETPLSSAIMRLDMKMANILLHHGASPSFHNGAAFISTADLDDKNAAAFTRLLLQYEPAPPTIVAGSNNEEYSILEIALTSKKIQMANELVMAGVPITEKLIIKAAKLNTNLLIEMLQRSSVSMEELKDKEQMLNEFMKMDGSVKGFKQVSRFIDYGRGEVLSSASRFFRHDLIESFLTESPEAERSQIIDECLTCVLKMDVGESSQIIEMITRLLKYLKEELKMDLRDLEKNEGFFQQVIDSTQPSSLMVNKLRLLNQYGASPNLLDRNGKTCLFKVSRVEDSSSGRISGKQKLIEVLLELGANLNIKCEINEKEFLPEDVAPPSIGMILKAHREEEDFNQMTQAGKQKGRRKI